MLQPRTQCTGGSQMMKGNMFIDEIKINGYSNGNREYKMEGMRVVIQEGNY